MSEGDVPRGPLKAAVKAVTRPFRAWARGGDDEPDFAGYAVQVGTIPDKDGNPIPVYAPLGSGRTYRFRSLDDWRSRL